MGQVAISETTLANLNQATRTLYKDNVTRDLTQIPDAVDFANTEEMWSWVKMMVVHIYIFL